LEFRPSSFISRFKPISSIHTLGIVTQRFGDGWLAGASPVFGIESPRQKADAGHPTEPRCGGLVRRVMRRQTPYV